MNERLKILRRELGIKQGEFAKKINLNQGTLSDIENGKGNLTERNIKLVCLTFNVNEQWFRTGEGEMFTPEPSDTEEIELLGVFRKLSKGSRKLIVDVTKGVAEIDRSSRTL